MEHNRVCSTKKATLRGCPQEDSCESGTSSFPLSPSWLSSLPPSTSRCPRWSKERPGVFPWRGACNLWPPQKLYLHRCGTTRLSYRCHDIVPLMLPRMRIRLRSPGAVELLSERTLEGNCSGQQDVRLADHHYLSYSSVTSLKSAKPQVGEAGHLPRLCE